ncbi:hypothetical protein QA612_08630 [Evansella sp. AB-P1]|uniref:hypothetical protein n=1 Tax=Evansella sp. AB-P1 TaxID=3037653 RepID=UPI00241E82E9|nr:hypothetical protein [Evansella sp. AB-P1]MDG5787559.1 hypothetical protein [Evansella sp. AB-P1]
MNDYKKIYCGTSATTAELYQLEKDVISLRSTYRPNHFNTINVSFRQTKFPEECN